MLHVGLLALSLIFLPIFASSDWKPQGDEQPIARILLLLLATNRPALLLLSTDDAAPAGVVLAPLPQPRALSPVRALQTWLRCSRWWVSAGSSSRRST